jgi:putative transposase
VALRDILSRSSILLLIAIQLNRSSARHPVPQLYPIAYSNTIKIHLKKTGFHQQSFGSSLNYSTGLAHFPTLAHIKYLRMSYEFAEGYKIRDQGATHFLTFSIMGWIDVFSRQRYRDIILNSFQFCRRNKDLKIGAYVIMSNHIHTIWTASHNNLSDILRDFKTYTSKAITTSIQNDPESRREWLLYMFNYFANGTNANDLYKVWTGNNHPEEIHSDSFMKTKLNYIHENPVRAGLVKEPSHYLYSSAADYEGKKGITEIDLLY